MPGIQWPFSNLKISDTAQPELPIGEPCRAALGNRQRPACGQARPLLYKRVRKCKNKPKTKHNKAGSPELCGAGAQVRAPRALRGARSLPAAEAGRAARAACLRSPHPRGTSSCPLPGTLQTPAVPTETRRPSEPGQGDAQQEGRRPARPGRGRKVAPRYLSLPQCSNPLPNDSPRQTPQCAVVPQGYGEATVS